MTRTLARIRAAAIREEGQEMAEYALVLALVAVVATVALTALGLSVASSLDRFTSLLPPS